MRPELLWRLVGEHHRFDNIQYRRRRRGALYTNIEGQEKESRHTEDVKTSAPEESLEFLHKTR
jgi:hypothetical protein